MADKIEVGDRVRHSMNPSVIGMVVEVGRSGIMVKFDAGWAGSFPSSWTYRTGVLLRADSSHG